MATSIQTMVTSGFAFTSDLGDIKIKTDLEQLIIRVNAFDVEDYYTTILYAEGGYVTFRGLRELIEAGMQERGLSITGVAVNVYDLTGDHLDYDQFEVIYSAYRMPVSAEQFVTRNFLSTKLSKDISPTSIETLYAITKVSEVIEADVVYLNSDGKHVTQHIVMDELPSGSGWTLEAIDASPKYIQSRLEDTGAALKKLFAYTLILGSRTMVYYINRPKTGVLFTFRNCFNAYETAIIEGVTVTKTKIDQNIAVSGDVRVPYDKIVEKSYEVQTAPLMPQELSWIEQLFMSMDVRLGQSDLPENLPAIVITESSCEITDSNTETNKVKFEWAFAEELPYATLDLVETDIFGEQFTYQYM